MVGTGTYWTSCGGHRVLLGIVGRPWDILDIICGGPWNILAIIHGGHWTILDITSWALGYTLDVGGPWDKLDVCDGHWDVVVLCGGHWDILDIIRGGHWDMLDIICGGHWDILDIICGGHWDILDLCGGLMEEERPAGKQDRQEMGSLGRRRKER